jgi:hypothetical protein
MSEFKQLPNPHLLMQFAVPAPWVIHRMALLQLLWMFVMDR